MLDCLFIGFGGFIGTVCRYLIGLLPLGTEGGFPVKTLAINILGAFVLGLIAALAAREEGADPRLVLMLKVGVCGGFTTFSTLAFETAGLLQNGRGGAAFAYAVLSLVLGVAAVFGAQALVR